MSKLTKSSKFLSPPQADGVLRNFATSGTDFAQTWYPRSKLRGIQQRISIPTGSRLPSQRGTYLVYGYKSAYRIESDKLRPCHMPRAHKDRSVLFCLL